NHALDRHEDFHDPGISSSFLCDRMRLSQRASRYRNGRMRDGMSRLPSQPGVDQKSFAVAKGHRMLTFSASQSFGWQGYLPTYSPSLELLCNSAIEQRHARPAQHDHQHGPRGKAAYMGPPGNRAHLRQQRHHEL